MFVDIDQIGCIVAVLLELIYRILAGRPEYFPQVGYAFLSDLLFEGGVVVLQGVDVGIVALAYFYIISARYDIHHSRLLDGLQDQLQVLFEDWAVSKLLVLVVG